MKKIFILLLIYIFSFNIGLAYNLTQNDIDISDTISEKILVQDDSYKDIFFTKIQEIIESWDYSERVNAILENIQVSIVLSQAPETIEQTEENSSNETSTKIIHTENGDINFHTVKNNWLDWNNEVRSDLWLNNYWFSSSLENSALIWSQQAKESWDITHQRSTSSSYYDYNEITSWFADNGVVCKNISGITHTENIWWGNYSCSDGECTDELSTATQRTFDYYMSEKTENGAHYRSLTQEHFTEIWLWITIDEISDNYYKYYLTIHYCSELVD